MPSNINGWFIHFIIFFICSIMNIMIINTHKTPERDPRSLDSITHICCRISDTLHSHDHSASMILAFFSHISKYISRNFLGYPRPPFNIGVNHSCSRSKHYPSYIICSTRLSDCRRLESFIFAKRLLDKIESPKSKRSSKVQAYHLLSASVCLTHDKQYPASQLLPFDPSSTTKEWHESHIYNASSRDIIHVCYTFEANSFPLFNVNHSTVKVFTKTI